MRSAGCTVGLLHCLLCSPCIWLAAYLMETLIPNEAARKERSAGNSCEQGCWPGLCKAAAREAHVRCAIKVANATQQVTERCPGSLRSPCNAQVNLVLKGFLSWCSTNIPRRTKSVSGGHPLERREIRQISPESEHQKPLPSHPAVQTARPLRDACVVDADPLTNLQDTSWVHLSPGLPDSAFTR